MALSTRAALLRIISAFKTVATQTLEVECHILPLHLRLKQRGQEVVTRLCTLPPEHPLTNVMDRLRQRIKRKGSQSSSALVQTIRSMGLSQLQAVETIDPVPREPWGQSAFDEIVIEHDKTQALDNLTRVMTNTNKVLFTDASIKDGRAGAAVMMLDQVHGHHRTAQIRLGPASDWTVHAAELAAVQQAVELIKEAVGNKPRLAENHDKVFAIVSDSQAAVGAIANPTSTSGQHTVRRILDQVQELREQTVKVRLLWIPGHAGIEGNEIADQLAKQARRLKSRHEHRRPVSTYKRQIHKMIAEEWRREWVASPKGKHLKRIDDGLPAKRALRLYTSRTRHQAYLLVQLRTGHSWLATFAKLFGFADDNRCVCGAVETVVHVVVDCPRLREARKQLRDKVGDAFGSIASLLEGRNGQGRVGNSDRERNVLQAVLEFAETSQRFSSRASAAKSRVRHRP